MNCHEVREQHSVSSRDGTSLTERALAHVHIAQCADCRAERASFTLAPPSAEPPPVNLAIVARAARETIRTELTQVLGVPTRLRLLTSSSLVVSTRAGVRGIEGTWAGLSWLASRLRMLVMLPARAVAGLVDGVRFVCVRAARLAARLGSAAMIACHGAVRAAGETGGAILGLVSRSLGATVRAAGRVAVTCWLGVLRTRDVLVRVGGWVPSLAAPFARAGGHLVGTIPGLVDRARFAGARSARGLTRLGAAAMMACHGAGRAVGGAAGAILGLVWRSLAEAVRTAGWAVARLVGTIPGLVAHAGLAGARSARGLTRLGAAAMMACHGAGRAVGGAAGAILGLVWRSLAEAVRTAGWAVARLVGTIPGLVAHAGLAGARSARGLTRLGAALMMACHGAARAAAVAAGALLGLMSRFIGESVRAAGRVIAICWLGALRLRDVLVRFGGRMSAVAASSTRAVGHLVGTIPAGARAHPRVCAGIVSGVVIVSSLLFLGPRPRPDALLSPGEGMRRDPVLSVDRKPAEPVVATPVVVQDAPPRPAPMPQPIPARRVAAPETHAAIPAPVRRSEPVAVEAQAEPSDPAAAIDWLLKGSARRRTESP